MADPGSTILNLPATAALGDTDVLPLARPSGTTAPGTDLGITGAALKAIIAASAAKGGVFRGAWAANTAYGQFDSTFIPAGNPNAGLLAFATVAFTSPAAYVAANWTLEPGQSTNDYTSPEKAKLAGLAMVATSGSYPDLLNKPAFLAPAANLSDLISIPTARQNLGLNGMLMMTQPTGERTYFADFETAQIAANPGATVAFGPGAFGAAGVDIFLKKDLNIVLDPHTVWTFGVLYLHVYNQATARQVNIFGTGTGRIVGTVFAYGAQTVNCFMSNLRHEGSIIYNSYLGATTDPTRFVLQNVTGVCTAAQVNFNSGLQTVTDYLLINTRSGVYKPCQVEVYNCTISTSTGGIFHSINGTAADVADNLLRLFRSTLLSAGPVIVLTTGSVTFDFAQNAYLGALPANVASGPAYSFLGMPGAFTPITQNQYGTHPAFSAQFALNAYLLGGAAPAGGPTVSNPTFTATPSITSPTFTTA